MYAPHTQPDVDAMLAAIGVASLDELLKVPDAIALKAKLDVVPALPEYLIQRRFDQFAEKNAGRRAIVRSWAEARIGTTRRRRFPRSRCAASS